MLQRDCAARRIAQHADVFDFELDDVARLQESHLLESATIADRARSRKLAGVKRLGARNMGDE